MLQLVRDRDLFIYIKTKYHHIMTLPNVRQQNTKNYHLCHFTMTLLRLYEETPVSRPQLLRKMSSWDTV